MAGENNALLEIIAEDSITGLVQSSTAEQKVVDNLNQRVITEGDIVKLNQQAAEDKRLVQLTNDTAALRAQQLFLSAANKGGLTPDRAVDIISENIKVATKAGDEINTDYQKYIESKQGTIFELGPIDWFKKRYEGGEARERIERNTVQQQLAVSNIQKINAVLEDGQKVARHVQESITAGQVAANANLAAYSFNEKALNARKEQLKYGGDLAVASLNANKERLSMLYSLAGIQQQAKNFDLQLKNFARQEEIFDFQREKEMYDRTRKNQADQEAEEFDNYAWRQIETGMRNRGINTDELPRAEVKRILNTFKLGGDIGKEYVQDYLNGKRTNETGIPFLGSSAAATVKLLKSSPTNLPENRKGLTGLLLQIDQAVRSDPKFTGAKPEQIDLEINNRALTALQVELSNVRPESPMNFGDIASYLQLTGVKDLPVVKNVLAPAAAQGTPLDKPEMVLGLISKAIREKTLTHSQGMEFATVAQLANEVHLSSIGVKAAGIALPDDGKRYIVNLKGGRLNLTNAQEISRYLTTIGVAEAMRTPKGYEANRPNPTRGALSSPTYKLTE